MFKPVSCENLSKTNHEKLKTNGIRYYQDIINSKTSWTREIYEEIERQRPVFNIKSALDLWQVCFKVITIILFIKYLDIYGIFFSVIIPLNYIII